MKKARTAVRLATLVASLLALAPAAQAQSTGDRQQPGGAARSKSSLDEQAVANNRTSVIQQIVSTWQGAMANAAMAEQFQMTLTAASNQQLAQILTATTYKQVRDVLLATLAGAANDFGILSLGESTNDLVYTPVNPPCRIFDTRNYGGGVPPPGGSVRDYQVYGSAATMAAQGGNGVGAGCPAPKGEPVAVSANFTAVPVGNAGHIRVYPFGGSVPTVSFVNFQTTGNIANSGIVSTCFGCAADLSIFNAVTVHHIGDVMGYFYPAPIDFADNTDVTTAIAVAGDQHLMSSVPITPTHNGKCLVTTHAQIDQDAADTYGFTFVRTARQIGAGAPANDGVYGLYTVPVAGRPYTASVSSTYVWDVVAGTTYRFGCYVNTGGDLVGNIIRCRTTRMCF